MGFLMSTWMIHKLNVKLAAQEIILDKAIRLHDRLL